MTPVPTMGSTVSSWMEAEREVSRDHEKEKGLLEILWKKELRR